MLTGTVGSGDKVGTAAGGFPLALQIAKGLIDLLGNAAAVDIPHHDQRHGVGVYHF